VKTAALSSLSAPLQVPAFRRLWTANIVSNIGTLMQAVGAAWLMTGLTSSTTLVGLVQTASTLPVFLVGLLAGALADTMERKSLLFWSQLWMLAMAILLGVLTLMHLTTPWVLLALTFALGLGSAISLPAWQATVQDIVPREAVPAAISLNSISFNVARSVGPALGGILVAVTGPAAAFLVNAASFLAVLGAIATWKAAPRKMSRLAEDIPGAIRAGFRYLIHARRLQVPIIRASAFNLCAGAVWPLLPLFARDVLHTTATGYGLLLAAFGMGSVVSAIFMPRLRNMVALDRIVAAGAILCALSFLGLSAVTNIAFACLMLFFAGASWVGVLVNFNVAVQTAVPAWVRGRALAFYLLAFQGVLALDGYLWGTLAGEIGISQCFTVAAIGLVLGLGLIRFFPLSLNEDIDLRPSSPPDSHESVAMEIDDGPVLVTVEYQIAPEDAEAFRAIMHQMREQRLRDGARRWRLYHDAQQPERYLELFRLDSWGEHLRQRERVTVTDWEVNTQARAFHRGEGPPFVRHYLGVED